MEEAVGLGSLELRHSQGRGRICIPSPSALLRDVPKGVSVGWQPVSSRESPHGVQAGAVQCRPDLPCRLPSASRHFTSGPACGTKALLQPTGNFAQVIG